MIVLIMVRITQYFLRMSTSMNEVVIRISIDQHIIKTFERMYANLALPWFCSVLLKLVITTQIEFSLQMNNKENRNDSIHELSL